MISTRTGSGAGPIAGCIAQGRTLAPRLQLYAYRKQALSLAARGSLGGHNNRVESVRWSADGSYVVSSARGEIVVYQRTGANFSPVVIPANLSPASYSGDCAISADGSTIAACGVRGSIWGNNAGTFSVLGDGDELAPATRAVALTSNGSHAAFLGADAPYLRIWARSGSGGGYNAIPLASQPEFGATSVFVTQSGLAFSPDNTYLAVVPYIIGAQKIYKWSLAGTYEQLAASFDSLDACEGCAWSPDGAWLALASSAQTYFSSRNGDVFTAGSVVTGGYRGNFHPSNNYYVCGTGQVYRKTSNAWVLSTQIDISAYSAAAAFSPIF